MVHSFISCNMIAWFWYQSDTSLKNWARKVFFPVIFSEIFLYRIGTPSSINARANSPVSSSESLVFFVRKILIINLILVIDMGLFKLSSFCWVSFGHLYLSGDLSIYPSCQTHWHRVFDNDLLLFEDNENPFFILKIFYTEATL